MSINYFGEKMGTAGFEPATFSTSRKRHNRARPRAHDTNIRTSLLEYGYRDKIPIFSKSLYH